MTTLPKSIHFIYCQSVTRGKLRPTEGQKIQKANPPIDNPLLYMGLNEIMVASLFSPICNRLLFNSLDYPWPPHSWMLASASMTLRESCNVRPAHPSLKSGHLRLRRVLSRLQEGCDPAPIGISTPASRRVTPAAKGGGLRPCIKGKPNHCHAGLDPASRQLV